MSDEGVCRTAPDTPGLLITGMSIVTGKIVEFSRLLAFIISFKKAYH